MAESKEPKPLRGVGATKSGGNTISSDKSMSFLDKVAKEAQNKAAIRAKIGRPVTFQLIVENNMPVYFSPKDIVYIPEDYKDNEYLANLIENDSDGEPLIGMQEIRYVRNINSIFVANQPSNVVIQPIEFKNLSTFNDKKEANLVKFLRLSNKNAANPARDSSNSVYTELIPERIAKEIYDSERVVEEARTIIYTEPMERLAGLANIYGITTKEPYEFKLSLKRSAERDPEEFIRLYNSPDLPLYERISVGISLGVVSFAGRTLKWKNGDIIFRIPPTVTNNMEYTVDFVKTDEEGTAFMEALDKEIEMILR